MHFDEILPISAKEGGEQIDLVKNKLRFLLDHYATTDKSDENSNIMMTLKENLKEKRPLLV